MKNFKDFITEKMRKDPKEEEARLLARMERVRSEIPLITKDETKLMYSKDPSIAKSKEAIEASGKLMKQAMKTAQFSRVDAALQGVEDIVTGATGKQTSALSSGFGTKKQVQAYKTAVNRYKK
jgi:hypothetical protein